MRNIVKAILFSSFYILIFTVLPSLSLWLLPPEIKSIIPLIREYTGIDIPFIILVTLVIGVILAALSFLRNIISERSIVNLIAGLLTETMGVFLSAFLLGLGNPLSIGIAVINFSYSPGGTVIFDLRLAVVLSMLISLMSSIKTVINFYYVRKEGKE